MSTCRLKDYIQLKIFNFPDAPPRQRLKISQKLIFPRKGARKAIWPIVSLFIFDSLPQYPILFGIGYWGKPSNRFDGIAFFPKLCDRHRKKAKQFNKSLHFGRAWYLCRGPPDCRCFHPFEQRQFRRKLCLIHIAITH